MQWIALGMMWWWGTALGDTLQTQPPGAWCAPDAHEPNDERSAARPLSGTVSGSLCAAEVDWYRVDLKAGQTWALRWRGGAGEVRVSVFAPRRRKPSARFEALAGSGEATLRVKHGGAHRIRVEHQGGPPLGYQLEVTEVLSDRGGAPR